MYINQNLTLFRCLCGIFLDAISGFPSTNSELSCSRLAFCFLAAFNFWRLSGLNKYILQFLYHVWFCNT